MTTITIEISDDLAQRLDPVKDRLPEVLELGLQELAPLSAQAYMEVLEFLANDPSPEEILAFRPSSDVQSRVRVLLYTNQQGLLTKAEADELDRISDLEHSLILLKAHTRRRMTTS